MDGPIQWDAYMMGGAAGPVVDLLEWQLPPPVGTPYDVVNHLGFSRLCFMLSEFDGLYAKLRVRDVPCLSAPICHCSVWIRDAASSHRSSAMAARTAASFSATDDPDHDGPSVPV